MFTRFFAELRAAKVPVSFREYLDFLAGLDAGLALYDTEAFYFLARTSLVKDERQVDRFDRVFGRVFAGLEGLTVAEIAARLDLPDDWLRKLVERHLTPEEKAQVEAMGGFDKLMQALADRLREQQGRHQGGSKWIGTAGTSPFGAFGYNPEGVRIGQDEGRHGRAVKVWDRREFRDLDDDVELGTRAIKVALRRLRRWAREGARRRARPRRHHPADRRAGLARGRHPAGAAERGQGAAVPRHRRLDGRARAPGRGAVLGGAGGVPASRALLLPQLPLRGGLARQPPALGRADRRRRSCCGPTAPTGAWWWSATRRCRPTRSPIRAGPASTGTPRPARSGCGGCARPGRASIWINPIPEEHWGYTASIAMIAALFDGRMFPMTLGGLDAGIRELAR